ncbi:hypothetical protein ACH4SP_09120 [Streptomyces sp. NPDC021093]|uniref:hypothetical protein n=1 Tax=Streptomyces sp. NPDC021093 TaxID=3365112 RepID=UPI00379F4D2E
MSSTVNDASLPAAVEGSSLPFFYGTFTNIGFDYLLPADKVQALLRASSGGEQLSAGIFEDGKALVSLNYQQYFAQFARGSGITQEIELNIVAFPTKDASLTPKLTYRQYAMGEDQTRRLGFWRTHVDCDNDNAIKAGKDLFAEPKHKAGFAIVLPVPNATTPAAAPPDEAKRRADAVDVWHVDCGVFGRANPDGTYPEAERYYTVDANLRGLTAQPVSAAPFTEYGSRKVKVKEVTVAKPLAAPLNVFSPYTWYDLSGATGKVKVTLGKAPHQDGARSKEFVELLKGREPVGAWVHQSPPVAVQNRPYWMHADPARS